MYKVLVDGIHIGQSMKGVGLYTANTLLYSEYYNKDLDFYVVILKHTMSENNKYLPKAKNIKYITIDWKNHLYHGLYNIPDLIRIIDPDVVWMPYELGFRSTRKKYAVLCHDIPKKMRYAQKSKESMHRKIVNNIISFVDDKLLAKTLRRANIVFCNSNYVGSWLNREIGIETSKIFLAPCAPGHDFEKLSENVDIKSIWNKLGTPCGYILCIYTGDKRENFSIIPKMYKRLVESGCNSSLVIAGVRESDRQYVESQVNDRLISNKVKIISYLDVDRVKDLAELYAAALIYLDTSLHEGFGMQVVEAMACKTAVICSNRGALPEVVGHSAILINPTDEIEISISVQKLLNDNKSRELVGLSGYERSKIYKWENTAKTIFNGLLTICENKL